MPIPILPSSPGEARPRSSSAAARLLADADRPHSRNAASWRKSFLHRDVPLGVVIMPRWRVCDENTGHRTTRTPTARRTRARTLEPAQCTPSTSYINVLRMNDAATDAVVQRAEIFPIEGEGGTQATRDAQGPPGARRVNYFVSMRIRNARKPFMSLNPCGTPGGT